MPDELRRWNAAPPAPPALPDRRPFLRRPTLYPELYACYVLVSALDILFTWRILCAGGREINAVADWIIARHDVPGLALFKFVNVVLVVLICEIVGRRRYETGAKLARWAVVLSTFPVVVGAAHLLRIALGALGY